MIDVLVIDDEEALRELLLRVLVREGYKVEGAANGEQGLKAFANTPARLVVIDMAMPKMDGARTIAELRRTSHRFGILVISGNPSLSREIAGSLGADAVLTKPFLPAAFLEAVRGLLDTGEHSL